MNARTLSIRAFMIALLAAVLPACGGGSSSGGGDSLAGASYFLAYLFGPSGTDNDASAFGSISSRVTEAMTPAAAGMGQPVKSRLGLPVDMMARQLKRASRMAPQRT